MAANRTDAVKLFFELSHILRGKMKKEFLEKGITMPQGLIIGLLSDHGELMISELSTMLGFTNSTTSGIIDRLEKQGIVERTRSKEDKRIVNVKLLPKFSNIHDCFHKTMEAKLERLLEKGTDEEFDRIREGLEVLKRVLAASDDNI